MEVRVDLSIVENFLKGGLAGYLTQDLATLSLLLTIILFGLAIFIMVHYDGDWNSFIWYTINAVVLSLGFAFFIIPGIILLIYWAKRAGIVVAILGLFWPIGAAIGSSFGYESDGILS